MIDASNEIIIDSKDIEVMIDKDVSLIDNNIDVKTLEPEYEVTINRKEYNVVGDELYIPKRYEDAPQWLRDVIDNVTDVALSAKISEINNLTQSLNNLIDELEVAKNTYTMSVVSSNDINERINTAITTLNSSVMESDATILGLATTRVTPDQAQAISIDAIRTSLNDTISGNSLGSIISGMQSTTTTGDYTNAQSIEVLQSTIEGNADSTASAIDTINTFAGIDSTGAYTYTGLTGYLVDPNTGMIGGGQSELQNTITTTGDNVEAKFEYGSNIKIGGQYHNAGFGLKTTMTGGDGTIADPYNSEFWINAEKFKFTNNNKTGSKAPFTIDASGATPQISFNGIVNFSNVTDYTPPDISGTINANNDVFAQRLGYLSYADMVSKATAGQTIISGGYLRTNLIQAGAITANQINTVGLIAENISANTISGKTITGSTITGGTISGNTISGNTISGGTVTGTSIIGGSISGTTGTFSGEMTVGKFGNADMTISNGIAYIPIIAFDSIELSTFSIYDGSIKYLETTGPLLRSTCSFQITGVGSIGAGEQLFVYYSVDNGGKWVEFANFTSSSSSFTRVFSASGVSAVANSRIRIRIASQGGSFHGSIIVSNFS